MKDFHSRKHAFEDQYKYLYFNRMNLAMKTSYGRASELEPRIIQILHQMHSDFERFASLVCFGVVLLVWFGL